MDVKNTYESFEFYKAYKSIYDFCNEVLSMKYLDMIKGRLYTYAKSCIERRSAQTVIYEVLNTLVRMVAPILVFTAEEIWQGMSKENKDSSIASAHLLEWPKESPDFYKRFPNEFHSVIQLIPDVAKLLEEKRGQGLIGSSFDAKIKLLTNNEERYRFLESLKDDLCEIFKVSQVEIKLDKNLPNLDKHIRAITSPDITIEVGKAEGTKCVRCWNYSLSLGNNKNHPLICDKCLKVIGGT